MIKVKISKMCEKPFRDYGDYLRDYIGTVSWYWEWCDDPQSMYHYICFIHEEDALAFKLKFGL